MNNPETVDLVVDAKWLLPVVPKNRILENCSLVIDKGRIKAICPQTVVTEKYAPREHIKLGNHALMPGLINAHGHSPMTLLRGFADDLPLMTWLEKHIWPAETKWVSEDFVQAGSQLAMAEMILSGTTTFSDMYFFPEITAKFANAAGMRVQVNFPVLEFPTVWASDAQEYIHKGLRLRDNFRSMDLVSVAFGPHAPYSVSDESLQSIATYQQELQMPVHIHLHEVAHEVEDSMRDFGIRPIQRLSEAGLLGPQTQCVHMTQVNESDIELLQTHGAHVIHCPRSNLKLASGFCPVQKLLEAEVNVCLGTDGAASNNAMDMFSEMNFAALLAKGVADNAAAVPDTTALELATINGAKALGVEDDLGSLEPGKLADFIALDLHSLPQQPMYNLASHLVYTNMAHNVSHVWVNGKMLLQDRELKTLDKNEVIARAHSWQKKISS